MTTVKGYCPMGCGETLTLGAGGYITCSSLECERPDAVTEILEDRETQHIITLGAIEFTIKHPLRERLDDALLKCRLHAELSSADGPPHKPGTYRVNASRPRREWVEMTAS
jgi:hypothetical protein